VKREQVIAAREERWVKFEELLGESGLKPRKRKKETNLSELPLRYRQVCQDLALAKHRLYGRELVQRLNRLALQGHEQLHTRPGHFLGDFIRFVRIGFPSLVRENAAFFGTASALFYGPCFLMMLAGWFYPEAILAVLGPEQMRQYEDMYNPDTTPVLDGRGSDSDLYMFGYYIQHNIGIGFRTFAGGVLCGAGSVFFLIFNGLAIGATFAHLTRTGMGETLYPFVVGHGAFELTAITFSGAAGLKLGYALLAPGRLTRGQALVEHGKSAVRIMFGAAGMLLIAAFIEGFWSPSSAPTTVKYAVGAVLWSSVLAYFLFAGRKHAAR
jgi:uncharacterized membrane protein SpoIIM required for sporulation